MRISLLTGGIVAALLGFVGALIIINTFTTPPIYSVQRGYRGLAIEENYQPKQLAKVAAANVVPAPEDPQTPAGQKSSEVYENVKVLGDVDANEFLRVMAAITNWVSPEQGCGYCHVDEGFASDAKYTKVVARRMLQMTQYINTEWTQHVAATGVTCYTCHRGNPVPKNVWYQDVEPRHAGGMSQAYSSQNMGNPEVGYSSLPRDIFTPFLQEANEIRVIATQPLPAGQLKSIKQAEWTYGLMFHFSSALGVNCTYCHNSRSFAEWNQSSPQRVTAWYGIRMVRNVNNDYLTSLTDVFPDNRKGPHGDVAKTNCATCHQGAFKPLLGASMLKDYPYLGSGG